MFSIVFYFTDIETMKDSHVWTELKSWAEISTL